MTAPADPREALAEVIFEVLEELHVGVWPPAQYRSGRQIAARIAEVVAARQDEWTADQVPLKSSAYGVSR